MFRKVKDLKGPIILLVKTEKGKGYCFAEENKEKVSCYSTFLILKLENTYKSSFHTQRYLEINLRFS